MEPRRLARVDSFMRLTHLYTGLFLAPWLLIYGSSVLGLNHRPWFVKTFNIEPPRWERVRVVDFAPDDGFPRTPAEQAQAILLHLDLDGAHRIQGQPNANQMIIIRPSGTGNYRITWRPHQQRLIVDRQPFSAFRLLHALHFRGGYIQKRWPNLVWAVIVDAVALSMWVWVVSGIYLWWRRPRQRPVGAVCLAGGVLLFITLVVLFCL